MDYGNIFVYCLYACIQMYILMSVGYYAFKRGFFTVKSISIVSEVLFNFLIPVYGIWEITKIGTIEILNIFWILVANFVTALIISYAIAVSFHYGFKLDKRIKESYNLMCTLPAMGALPLVIGKAFCFPGGPIEGDIYCQNMIGLMMLCYLILCISVFLIGYILLMMDKRNNGIIQTKMIYLWPILVDKLFKKDYTVLYLFKKYLVDQKRSEKLFEKFDQEHHKEIIDLISMKRINSEEQQREGEENKLQEEQEKKVKEIPINTPKIALSNGRKSVDSLSQSKQLQIIEETNKPDKNDSKEQEGDVIIVDTISNCDRKNNDSLFDKKENNTNKHNENRKKNEIELDIKTNKNYKNKNDLLKSRSFYQQPKYNVPFNDQFCILFERKDSFYPGDDFKKLSNLKEEEGDDDNQTIYDNHITYKYIKPSISNVISKLKDDNLIKRAQSQYFQSNLQHHSFLKQSPRTISKHSPKNTHPTPEEAIEIASESLLSSFQAKAIRKYYQTIFDQIEEYPDQMNKQLLNEYQKDKSEILFKVSSIPPKYPIVRSVTIDQKALDLINAEWEIFEPKLKELCPSYKGIETIQINLNVFLKKTLAPPTISIMLGLILSISGLRRIIFNTENFFLVNVVDGVDVLDKTMVPCLFLLIGLSVASTNGLSMNVPIKRIHVILIFIERFLLIPLIGLFFIYIWKEYYGGIVKESLAFRIIMFFPWCLPSAPNYAVAVNLTQYFFEEYGYLVLLQNASCVITMTILYMIYFITVGL